MKVSILFTNDTTLDLEDVIRIEYQSYILDHVDNGITEKWITFYKENSRLRFNSDNINGIIES